MRANLLDPDRQQIETSRNWIKSIFDGGGCCNSWIDWLETNYVNLDSDRCRQYRQETAPWYVPVIEAVESERYNYVSVLGSIGSGKSELLTQLVAASIDMDPAHTIVCGQTDHDIEEYGETRLYPVLRGIAALKKWLPLSAKNWRKDSLKMAGRMNLFLLGGNENSLQSKSVRRVFVDEAWLLATGALTYAIGRVHGRENGLVLVTGQGGLAQGEHWHFHQQCQPNVWGWKCPECDKTQPYDFKSQVKYEMARNDDNSLNYRVIQESARIVCPNCGTEYKEEDRKKLEGSYTRLPNSGRDNAISFRVPALGVPHVSLLDNIIRREKGLERMKLGDVSEYRSWLQQFNADWWAEDFRSARVLPTYDYEIGAFDGKPLPVEIGRAMGVDFQQTVRFFVVRSFFADNTSKLISLGELESDELVVKTARYYQVNPENVFCDINYSTQDCGLFCLANGFTALKGSGTDSWAHVETYGQKTTYHGDGHFIAGEPKVEIAKKFVSPPETREAQGKTITFRYYSATNIKDMLFRLITDGKWQQPKNVPQEWHEHLTAERKTMRYSAVTPPKPIYELIGHRANHLLDAEALVVAGTQF
jgi:Phage terminase large subunit (GpA)